MFFNLAHNFPLEDKFDAGDDDFIKNYFIIHNVDNNILYLMDDESPDEDIYAVEIPVQLAGKLKIAIGWRVWLEMVRTRTQGKEQWNVAAVGNVYPM